MEFPQASRPIFVHGCWRTGSTYVWSKFREQARYRCYLEPLHEALIDQPESHFEQEYRDQVTQKLRHPSLERHYFAEYPFRAGGGVEKFAKDLPYKRYCLEPGEEDAALEEYVANLLAHAGAHGQVPVLQFNRGLLRSRWLHKKFNSLDVLLLRDPFETWLSYKSFADRYFITVTACIAGQNKDSMWFKPLQEIVEVPYFAGETFQEDFNFYYQFTGQHESKLYALFYYFFVLTFLYNLPSAHAIVDLDSLTRSADARTRVGGRLAAHGLAISLADCRLPCHPECASQVRALEPLQQVVEDLIADHLSEVLAISEPAFESAAPFLSPKLRDLARSFLGSTRLRTIPVLFQVP